MKRMEVRFVEKGRERRSLGLWGEFEQDLKVMVGHFVEVCWRSRLKVDADAGDN